MQEVVQSVDRSLSILEVLSEYEDGLGITEISEKVGLHKSTIHRLLATLIYKGYVEQSSTTNKYKLTLKLFELGSKKVEKLNVVTVSRPFLHELMEKTNEVVHLVVREGNEIVYVSKVESENTIRMHSRIGRRAAVCCTAVGKSMLSHMSDEEVEEIWNTSEIKQLTQYTITDLNEFKEHLKLVRERGYAVDEQENELGVRCIGTSVFNYKEEVCGAISVSGPIISFTEDKIEAYAQLLKEYANKISKELGYKGI
ncbi:IclR family transcriptional regulator [Clostridium polyendosporum]|uniref:Glycerol operon regulatory protein n=1 Tax=Clostridium polyendosporum TaxID=69208 RepID=A0A919RZG8_9CLOT|nr:IclR family transcriptional regulator [Clostridium polyendosporum]GIM29405.1 IclR family transcriptional regulator [Clostridium polyendosporum]